MPIRGSLQLASVLQPAYPEEAIKEHNSETRATGVYCPGWVSPAFLSRMTLDGLWYEQVTVKQIMNCWLLILSIKDSLECLALTHLECDLTWSRDPSSIALGILWFISRPLRSDWCQHEKGKSGQKQKLRTSCRKLYTKRKTDMNMKTEIWLILSKLRNVWGLCSWGCSLPKALRHIIANMFDWVVWPLKLWNDKFHLV